MSSIRAGSSAVSSSEFALHAAFRFLRENAVPVLLFSVLLLIPCFWHTHIQAGDLGSHVYNAWLAQLAERHEISGIFVVRQWDNVLFDLMVLHIANRFGLVAAEKLAVSIAVLIFFWGVFAFLTSVSDRAPWSLTPFLAVLSYGYAFHMGFMNYFLSIGLAFFALAVIWRSGAGNWLAAAILAALAFLAHPIGFTLIVSVAVYVSFWRISPYRTRLALPLIAVTSFM